MKTRSKERLKAIAKRLRVPIRASDSKLRIELACRGALKFHRNWKKIVNS